MYQFYATFDASNLTTYVPDVPILLPASSWYRKGMKKPCLPDYVTHKAADSGGYIASRIWGEYRYSLHQYVDWLGTWSPNWAATMDYCCEQDLAVVTRERQEKTTANLIATWSQYKHVPWLWVPTIQGLQPEDYYTHALELQPIINDMAVYYAGTSLFRIGIGTLCRRVDSQQIRVIVETVRSIYPSIPIHLWGVKLESLWTLDLQHIASSDSAAWSGLWGDNRKRIAAAAAEKDLNKQQYLIRHVLPDYIARIQTAVETSYHLTKTIDTAWLRDQLHTAGYTLRIRQRNGRRYAYAIKRVGTRLQEIYLAPLHLATADSVSHKLGTSPAGLVPNSTSVLCTVPTGNDISA